MNSLEQALKDYLRIRRSLGFLLREPETSLRNFVAFLRSEGASYITKELALRWATQPTKVQPSTWAWRLGMVRCFATWHSAAEPRTEIPPAGLLPHRYRRQPPHIYSDEEIERLLRRTYQLPSPKGLRAHTYATLFGLLVATGMRVNEAVRLERPDVDLDRGIVYIRRTKFGKSRYVPVHPSTVDALKKYADARDRIVPAPLTPAFFISEHGRRITDCMARYTFAKLSQQVGLRVPANGHGHGPRLHDMRHRFAARTLIHWYRAGCDVERERTQAVHLPRAGPRERYLLVSGSCARTPSAGDRPVDGGGGAAMISADLPSLLQSFFTDRLLRQRQASPHTIAGYRDCFRLLLHFAKERLGKTPSKLRVEDLDAPFIGLFLEHLESVRKNSARTRNARLGAIHCFFQYAAFEEPALALHCQRILAIPNKRHERRPIEFLNREEIDALLAVPKLSTWLGRRDRTLLLVGVQTGLRVSELIGLNCQDVVLGTGAHVRCLGKGRKQRCTPLRPETARAVDAWLRERHGPPDSPAFPSIRGSRLSRDAVERLITKYAHGAEPTCPSLKRKNVSPHVLRHAAAMDLLQHGVDRSVIALWLGHESVETTQMYLHADMRLKEKALLRTAPLGVRPARYQPDDKLLAFLEGL